MPTYKVQMKDSVLVDSEYPNQQFSTSETTQMTDTQYTFFTFEDVPDAYKYKVITGGNFSAYGKALSLGSYSGWGNTTKYKYFGACSFWCTVTAIDIDTVTYKTAPMLYTSVGSAYCSFDTDAYTSPPSQYFLWGSDGVSAAFCGAALKYGCRTGSPTTSATSQVNLTHASSNRPYLLISYNDDNVSVKFSSMEPSGGYVARHDYQLFKWTTTPTGECAATVKSVSNSIQWRIGDSGSVSSVEGLGNIDYCVVPADTFPASDNIQWRAVVTLNSGETATSAWQTISTQEALSSAECLSPKNVYVDATQPTEFSWRHIISTGTEQTAWDIQTSLDGNEWTDLASGTGPETTTTVAASTFEAGTLYWRVRTYNTDDAASEWSEPAQVTVIDAPDAPAVRIDQPTPRAKVSWQSTGQEGYEIEVDGESIGVFFGVYTTYLFDDFLADGGHVVRVRIQNKYGYWSEWGSAGFTVTNIPGEAITLDGVGGNVATLEWTTEGTYDRYIIYRDGEIIGKTTGTSWTDNLMTGDATYYVRGIAAEDGNYTQSNNANLQYVATANRLAAVEDWDWITLNLSATDTPTTSISAARQFAATSYTGRKYPVAELSEFYSKSISINTAFPLGSSDAKTFEGLIGRVVCYKSISGDSVIGVLGSLAKTRNPFYQAYTCTISQIDWEEAVSIDP